MNELALLTQTEQRELETHEDVIQRGLSTFVEVGNSLLAIRDKRLYRAQYRTFEDYCRERWSLQRQRAYELMGAASVVKNLSEISDTVPAREAHAAPLTSLSPEQQREAWQQAVASAPNGKMTAAHVQETVDKILTPEPRFEQVGPSSWIRAEDEPLDREIDAALADESKPVCPGCNQVYDGVDCPNCDQRSFNYKRDSRHSVAADIYTPQGMDACQTPAYALDPLLPYLRPRWIIWEPAAGEGLLAEALYDAGYRQDRVVCGDLLTGQNFFEYEPGAWDCLVTNPPYSIQFQWLERCYQLGKPFALLLKVEILGTKTAQDMFDRFDIEVIFVSPRINFKMPRKGWDGKGAQFPTAWFTWKLNIGRQMSFARVTPDDN